MGLGTAIIEKAKADQRVSRVIMVDDEDNQWTWWDRHPTGFAEDHSLMGFVRHFEVSYRAGTDTHPQWGESTVWRRIDGTAYLKFGLPPDLEVVPEPTYNGPVVYRSWVGFYIEMRHSGEEWSVWTWRPGSGWSWLLKTVRRQEAAKEFKRLEQAAWAA